jgi:hypothetical protein
VCGRFPAEASSSRSSWASVRAMDLPLFVALLAWAGSSLAALCSSRSEQRVSGGLTIRAHWGAPWRSAIFSDGVMSPA